MARLAAGLVGRLLANLGIDALPDKIGLGHVFTEESKASDLTTRLIMFFAMPFATVEAANRLGFVQVRDSVGTFITFGGDDLLGLVILTIGFLVGEPDPRGHPSRQPRPGRAHGQ